jgi:hypothetical protein
MIWIRLKNKDSTKVVVYTNDPDTASELKMLKRRKGKYWYKVMASHFVKKALGYHPKVHRGRYMSMVHMYPEASAYIKARQPIPLDVKKKMEEHMEWNPETKTFNDQKRLDIL